MTQTFSTRRLAMMALFSAILCILGPMSIPIGPVPISMTNFGVCLAAFLLGPIDAAISVVVYLVLGIVGLPVFSGAMGGLGKVAGPTGGYLVGFIFLALVAGFFVIKWPKNVVMQVVGMVVGTIVLYAFGTAWFCIQMDMGVIKALGLCVFPFLIGDAAKIAVATLISVPLKKQLNRMQK